MICTQFFLPDTRLPRILRAFAAVVLWAKSLYYARAYQRTGALVRMTVQALRDVRYFAGLLAVITVGFANASYLVFAENPWPMVQLVCTVLKSIPALRWRS